MRPQDIDEHLRRRPFQPFRMHLSDGTTYDIRHPELVMVGRSILLVGVPAPDLPGRVFERYDTVSLIHITHLEPIGTPATPASQLTS